MPKVTYILAIHNAAEYLELYLKRLGGQEPFDFECIIVDDESTDGSYRIARRFEKMDSRYKYVEKPASRFEPARNFGIPLAKGDYIHFLDTSDFYYAALTNSMLLLAEKSDSDIVICNYRYDDEKRRRSGRPQQDACFRDHVCELLYNTRRMDTCNSKLYRREVIEKSQARFDNRVDYGADLMFDLKVFPSTHRISVIEEIRDAAERPDLEEGYSSVYKGEHWGKELKLLEALDKYMEANGIKRDEYYEKFVETHICRGIDAFRQQECKKSLYRIRTDVEKFCNTELPSVVSWATLSNIKRYANRMLGLIFFEEA